jgi:XTP/dITP diphosphohydrolase
MNRASQVRASWVLATSSAGKSRELSELLAPLDLDISPQSAFGVQSCEEPFLGFVENALAKARHASAKTGLPAFADDSGLMVSALKGRPGVRTSNYDWRWLLGEMQHVPEGERAAAFICVLVAIRAPDDPLPLIAQGRWRGSISLEAHGESGFGYDPVFFDSAMGCTAAQMTVDQKNARSHRGQAARALLAAW